MLKTISVPGTGLELYTADEIASRIAGALRLSCSRIEIAGSLRRRSDRVADIDLVCCRSEEAGTLFAPMPAVPSIERALGDAQERGILGRRIKSGERLHQFVLPGHPGVKVDIFVCGAERWGVIWALRTGPWEFSRALVTARSKGGRLDEGYKVHDGRLWEWTARGFKPLRTLNEMDFLVHAGGWVSPEDREQVGRLYAESRR